MKFILTSLLLILSLTVQGQQNTHTLRTSALENLQEFINLIQQKNYEEAYMYTSPNFSQSIMSLEEFTKYFMSVNKYYGDFIDYTIYDKMIPDSLPESTNSLYVSGEMTFENVSCFNSWLLEYAEEELKIDYFIIGIDEINNLTPFDSLAKNEIAFIKKRQIDKIYKSSPLLKRVESIENLTTNVEKFMGNNQSELEISDVEINVYGTDTYLNLIYKNAALSNQMTLEYLESNDTMSFYNIRFSFEDDFYQPILDKSPIESTIYSDSIYHYSFEYPSNWLIVDTAGNVVLIEEMKEDMIFPSIVFISVEDSVDLKTTIKLHEESLEEENGLKDLQLKSKSNLKFKAFNASRYQYTGRVGIPLLFIDILFIEAENKIYRISSMCSIDRKIMNEGKIRKIEDSLVIQN